jgi:hypothetical protein
MGPEYLFFLATLSWLKLTSKTQSPLNNASAYFRYQLDYATLSFKKAAYTSNICFCKNNLLYISAQLILPFNKNIYFINHYIVYNPPVEMAPCRIEMKNLLQDYTFQLYCLSENCRNQFFRPDPFLFSRVASNYDFTNTKQLLN